MKNLSVNLMKMWVFQCLDTVYSWYKYLQRPHNADYVVFAKFFLRIFGRDSWWKRLAGTKGRSRQSPLPTDDRRSG